MNYNILSLVLKVSKMGNQEELWLEGGGVRYVYTDDYVDSLEVQIAKLTAERDHWEQTCHAQWDNYQENIIPKLTAERTLLQKQLEIEHSIRGFADAAVQIEKLTAERDGALKSREHFAVHAEHSLKEITALKSALREANKVLEDFKIAIQDYQSHYLYKRLYKPTIKAIATINEVLK